jgi:hypothetical protein
VIQLDSGLRRVAPRRLGAAPHLVDIPIRLDVEILNEISLVLNFHGGVSVIVVARCHCWPPNVG